MIFDPLYKQLLVLVPTLPVSAFVVWQLYHVAAKVMLGGEQAYVHGSESRFRLPELALLAGNVLPYVAADSHPVASGLWDREARPTCGRLRRLLARQDFSKLPVCDGKRRKKGERHCPSQDGRRRSQKQESRFMRQTYRKLKL